LGDEEELSDEPIEMLDAEPDDEALLAEEKLKEEGL
jgi:hypothetical protein